MKPNKTRETELPEELIVCEQIESDWLNSHENPENYLF